MSNTYQRINYRGRLWCDDAYRVKLEDALVDAANTEAAQAATIKAQGEEIARQHELLKQSIPAAAEPATSNPNPV